jgi:translation initiation factor IF-2
MTEQKKVVRLSKAAKEFNIGRDTIVDFLSEKGFSVDKNPNTKLTPEMYDLLLEEFQEEKHVREIAQQKEIGTFKEKESISIKDKKKEDVEKDTLDDFDKELFIKGVGVEYSSPEKTTKKATKKKEEPAGKKEEKPAKTKEPAVTEEPEKETEETGKPKVLGKIDLDKIDTSTRPKKKTKAEKEKEKAAKKEAEKEPEVKEEIKEEAKEKQAEAEKEIPVEEPVEKEEKESETVVEETVAEKEEPETVEKEKDDNFIPTKVEKLTGPKILDKIELKETGSKSKKDKKQPVASSSDDKVGQKKKKRKRIRKPATDVSKEVSQQGKRRAPGKKREQKHEPTEEEIQQKIKETLARLAPAGKSKASKYRRLKRDSVSQTMQKELEQQEIEKSTLKVTEFLTANELANMMSVNVNEVIKSCMQLGLFVSINQRLDAETIVLVAEEFGYQVNFVDVDDSESLDVVEEEDKPEDLVDRAPIVTVMGHVDHGKTKLLDYIRKSNVVAGEAGGITQHIGAYEVTMDNGKKITFLDTPGHEAFTAMRARGAKVTDVAIIVIAADDSVMPQTKEAINHALAAGVPIVFAFNKMDKTGANADKIREQLSTMNILVEEWGGKYQSQEISAINGMGISELLEKVLLEAEMLELKANPNKPGKGTVIESALDKGRGYVATILVQDGTIKQGDIILAGPIFGKIRALYNERNVRIDKAGPSQPAVVLGLNGAPQAGDLFNIMLDEKSAKSLASKRQQLLREQEQRSTKHITLDEIGRRIAIGDFKELNIIVKGDVNGSVEALSDELLKLSTEEVQVNVIHKAVGAITESDVILASASDAIIIGFQVRMMPQARKLAEKEQIDVRLYSIIYQATEELQAAVEGILVKKTEEKVVCNIEVRDVFKISKVGTIAGCYVLDGKVTRNTSVRLIRDGIVIYTGKLGSLKRFKDDVKEVSAGYECGLNIENFNDIKVGDIIEGYEIVEVN